MLASDIDRTLLWSHKRLDGIDPAGLACLEVLDGRDWAYVTRPARTAIEALAASGELVPCTTRTPAQVQRLRLPAFRHVLCLNGGALLVDGEPDAAHARFAADLAAQVRPMREFAERVAHLVDVPHVRSLRDADGVFGYFLLTGDPLPLDWVEELTAIAAADAWRLTFEQSKVYAMPQPLTKEAGLTRVLDLPGADPSGTGLVAAAGDSLLDEGMLRMARHALVPAGAYLTSHGWDGPTTTATNVLAGEEIALWLRDLAGQGGPPGGRGARPGPSRDPDG